MHSLKVADTNIFSIPMSEGFFPAYWLLRKYLELLTYYKRGVKVCVVTKVGKISMQVIKLLREKTVYNCGTCARKKGMHSDVLVLQNKVNRKKLDAFPVATCSGLLYIGNRTSDQWETGLEICVHNMPFSICDIMGEIFIFILALVCCSDYLQLRNLLSLQP